MTNAMASPISNFHRLTCPWKVLRSIGNNILTQNRKTRRCLPIPPVGWYRQAHVLITVITRVRGLKFWSELLKKSPAGTGQAGTEVSDVSEPFGAFIAEQRVTVLAKCQLWHRAVPLGWTEGCTQSVETGWAEFAVERLDQLAGTQRPRLRP